MSSARCFSSSIPVSKNATIQVLFGWGWGSHLHPDPLRGPSSVASSDATPPSRRRVGSTSAKAHEAEKVKKIEYFPKPGVFLRFFPSNFR
jgi:hypothetical protein